MNRAAIEKLLPHRGTALWLNSVSLIEPTRIVGETTPDCLALYGKDCPSYLLFEAAAQLCAVHGASRSKQAKRAYVVKVQRLKVHQTNAVAKSVSVCCEVINKNEFGAQYHFEIKQADTLLAGNLLMVIQHA